MSCAASGEDAVYKSLTDNEFLTQYRADPEVALEGFDLNNAEQTALMSGEEAQINGLTDADIAQAPIVVVVVVD